MTYLRKSKFWLLSTAALVLGSHLTATAQSSPVYQPGTYQSGAPTMVAAAPSLPTISAEQIARDVSAEFNPRTGRAELTAAPFDPFEEDPYLAGSLRLRSADGAIAIDGQPLQNGARIDVDFYYNSPSDDPYGGRNYSDASFVSGELAPVVLRDTRILECSSRVNNVIYDHNAYYSESSYGRHGIYQPYRHYTGHSSFGFGFGSSYFGPGISYYNNNRSRSFGSRGRSAFLPRVSLPNAGRRRSIVRRDRLPTRGRGGDNIDTNIGTGTPLPRTTSTSNLTSNEIHQRIGDLRSTATDLRNGGSLGPRRSITAQPRIAIGPGPSPAPAAAAQPQTSNATASASPSSTHSSANAALSRHSGARGQTRTAAARQSIQKQSAPSRSAPKESNPKKTPTRSAPPKARSTSKPPSRSSSNRSSRSSRSARPRSSSSNRSSSSTRKRLNFFPNGGYGGRQVVTSQSVDCAREDKLSVFISNERLEAARFDGLTLIALDAQGGETPIYIPPNYIQGYRLAATGRVQPQGLTGGRLSRGVPAQTYQQPSIQPQSVPQNPRLETAPCPAGTQKQTNGTCLQTTLSRYPTP